MKPVVKWTQATFDPKTNEVTFDIRFTLVDDDISDEAIAALLEESKNKSFATSVNVIPKPGFKQEDEVRCYPYATVSMKVYPEFLEDCGLIRR